MSGFRFNVAWAIWPEPSLTPPDGFHLIYPAWYGFLGRFLALVRVDGPLEKPLLQAVRQPNVLGAEVREGFALKYPN